MAVPQKVRRLSEAEYLELERAAEFKSEFYEGEVFAMAGGTRWHSLIATNLTAEFANRLRGGRYVAFNADLRLKVEAAGLFTYPDLSVVCGEQRFIDEGGDTLLNPTLIVEVLSESTEAYDRGKKFELYQQIDSLREYLLVSQREPRIEQFLRQADESWVLRAAAGREATLLLPSPGITISLANIYANVDFAPTPIRPPAPPRR